MLYADTMPCYVKDFNVLRFCSHTGEQSWTQPPVGTEGRRVWDRCELGASEAWETSCRHKSALTCLVTGDQEKGAQMLEPNTRGLSREGLF